MVIKKFDSHTLTYNDSDETAREVFNALVAWYMKHECFTGEGLQQCDEPQIDAINILSDIADDVIKFDDNWKD